MRFISYKLFFAWDSDKEERWLNEMASKGMNLQGVGFCRYVFEEGTPGEYQYHIEWLKNRPSDPESVSYIRFLEEAGVEYIGSFKNWIYLRKKRSDGVFDLYSDLDSRIDHFRRIIQLILAVLAILLAYLVNVVCWCIDKNLWLFYLPIFAIFLLPCIIFGLVKTGGAYIMLRKERMMRE